MLPLTFYGEDFIPFSCISAMNGKSITMLALAFKPPQKFRSGN